MKSIKGSALVLILTMLCAVATISTPITVSADRLIEIFIDGNLILSDNDPVQLRDDRAFIPLRLVTENLGCTVDWNGDTQTVTIIQGDYTYTHAIGSMSITRNDGSVTTIDVPSFIRFDRTFVSIRLFAEAFGCSVNWNPTDFTIHISTSE